MDDNDDDDDDECGDVMYLIVVMYSRVYTSTLGYHQEKERNKKMPTPRHKVTHNPIPTSLFCFNIVCYECIRQSKQQTLF